MSDEEESTNVRFNKLRTTGGSSRLTLVKGAVDEAGIDPRPPRPTLGHLPAGPGVWLAFDLEQYPSQSDRVAARVAVSEALGIDESIVGEFPVELRGKLGSAVTRVPGELVERVDVSVGERLAVIAVAEGALLVAAERVVDEQSGAIERAVDAAQTALQSSDR